MLASAAIETVGEGYRLEREVGRGPIGVVYEGLELASGRPVCLKVLGARYTQDARFAVRFRDAYRRIAEVVHENLATVIDYGYQSGRYYIVSEWVEGEDLGSRLDGRGVLPYPHVVSIGRQISAGLEAAHGVGVLHRGLKPQNVLLGRDGQVKVTDLGLAGVVGETGLSKTGVLSSGAGYMAPEQARGESPGRESDVYSVGVLLYEMLTGRRPFEGSGSWSLLRRQVEEIPLQPSRVNPEVPFDLGAVVMIALRKEREARYGTAQALGEALEGSGIEAPEGTETAQDRPGASEPVRLWQDLASATRSVRRTARVWRRRFRVPSGLLVAVLFTAGFLVTFGALSTIVDAGGQQGTLAPEAQTDQNAGMLANTEGQADRSDNNPLKSGETSPKQAILGKNQGSLHVADLDSTIDLKGSSGRWEVFVTITVLDDQGEPVSGATITGEWDGARTGVSTGVTGEAGTLRITSGNMGGGGQITFQVTDIAHDSLSYDPSANGDPDGETDGTQLTARK